MATDWANLTWCERAALLTNAYYEALNGGSRKKIRYRGPNGEREVEYNSTNLAELKAAMQEAQAKCDAMTNGTIGRFAIRAGSRRTTVEPT